MIRFISAMRKVIPLILVCLCCFMVPVAIAEPSLNYDLRPVPVFSQVWAYETYTVNMSVQELNLSSIDFSSYPGTPTYLFFEGEVQWKGKGGYDFGGATTGYTYNLDAISIDRTVPIETGAALFNLTLEKDAYEYGILPFEIVQIILKFDVYVIMSDDSIGPKIASKTQTLNLIDEMKVSYLEGKYLEMEEEINSTIGASGIDSFNRERFLGILDDMNTSLVDGNYFEALDVWDDYNEDDRIDLIKGLIRASSTQYAELSAELEALQAVEEQLEEVQTDLAILELEYSQLENTYNTLSSTYLKVNSELDITKRNLSTAITAVFLTAILFYFLGRRGINREEAERLDESGVY